VKVIREHIEAKEKVNISEMFQDVDKIAEKLVNEFNEKYSEGLNDDEKNALKELSENNDKESIFNKYKSMCQEKLSEEKKRFLNEGDSESAEKIDRIYEQVGKKVFSENTVGTDICNLIEMVNVFNK
jgi:F0F1-type ATP synthase membrane subunit b/b'